MNGYIDERKDKITITGWYTQDTHTFCMMQVICQNFWQCRREYINTKIFNMTYFPCTCSMFMQNITMSTYYLYDECPL